MTDNITIQTKLNTVWALVQSMPDGQRHAAEQAIIAAYQHVTDNIQALITFADEVRLQRDIAINEIAFIQLHRGHISYDDVSRDMSMEIDGISYDDARNVVDVLCGTSDKANSWDVRQLAEAIRIMVENINENIALQQDDECVLD